MGIPYILHLEFLNDGVRRLQGITLDNATALKFRLEFWQCTCRTSHIYSCFQLLRSYDHNVSMFSYSLIYLMFSCFGKWNMNSWWLWMLSFTSLSTIIVMNVMWKSYSLAVGYTEVETMIETGCASGNPAEVGYSAPPSPQNFHIFLVIFYIL